MKKQKIHTQTRVKDFHLTPYKRNAKPTGANVPRDSYTSQLLGLKMIAIIVKTRVPITYKISDVTYLTLPK